MISIIIPIYNAQKTLSRCLDSILKNSCQDYEIIAINDGSTDCSWKILEEYQNRHSEKIRIFNQDNFGVAETRNKGMGYANGEYIMFIDNDDWIDSDYIEKFFEEISKKNLDLVIGGYRRATENGVLYKIKLENTLWSRYMTMAPWAKIYRKDFLQKNDMGFLNNDIGEDVYLNLQAINLTDKISIIDYCGYNWFYNPKSVSNAKQKNLNSQVNVMKLLNSTYEKLSEIGVQKNKEVEFYFIRYIIWYLLFAGKNSDSKQLHQEFLTTFAWLNDKFPKFYLNENISLLSPKGETLKNRLAVYVFMFIYRIGLTKLFLKIYSH